MSKAVTETHPVVAAPVSGLQAPHHGVLGEGPGPVPHLLRQGDLGVGDPTALRVGDPVIMWSWSVVWLSMSVPSPVPLLAAGRVAAMVPRVPSWGAWVREAIKKGLIYGNLP